MTPAADPAEVAVAGEPAVAVVGGGPAGLSAALYLARYLRPVVLYDSGGGRWTGAQVNHNYLGFPGGVAARRLHELGVEQLADYPHARVERARVQRCAAHADGFLVQTGPATETGTGAGTGAGQQVAAVVLASGVRDDFVHFPGWEAFVGLGLVWCLTCDGWESRGGELVVVGADAAAVGEALQLRRYTPTVTLVTNRPDPLPAELGERLRRGGVALVQAAVTAGEGDPASGRLAALRVADGRRIGCDRVFSVQGARPAAELAVALGARLGPHGHVEVDVEQRTSVPRLYAAGDLTRPHSHQVATAVHEGAQAASACNYDLYPAELR